MAHIELTTTVQAAPETVFDACLDVDVHSESMGTSAERAVGGVTTGRLKAGDAVTWEARHFGLPWRMTVMITDYRRPHGFIDQQVRGPFSRWHHEHRFMRDPVNPSATVMRDLIDFTAPWGPVGALVARLILRPYLRRLIARRNAYLASFLADPQPSDPRGPRTRTTGEGGAHTGRRTA
ncbi:SRPBCC family protein [Micromonospora sp. SL4-19]|uniref:SRPBCC family protein n=1 Tax=Micromonospora sp. SL4-19 TaxID=3399129 RepID=UPI003A4D29A6